MTYTNSRTAINQYAQVDTYSAISGADSHRLVLMLVEGALGKVAIARGGMERNDLGSKGVAIGQAISIIDGLRSSLDLEAGGELAGNLERLYDYMIRRLTQANLENDPGLLEEVASLLNEIRAGWEAIPAQLRGVRNEPRQAVAGG